MNIHTTMKVARKNIIKGSERPILNGILNEETNRTASVCWAFRCGVIQGKRAERARKKKIS